VGCIETLGNSSAASDVWKRELPLRLAVAKANNGGGSCARPGSAFYGLGQRRLEDQSNAKEKSVVVATCGRSTVASGLVGRQWMARRGPCARGVRGQHHGRGYGIGRAHHVHMGTHAPLHLSPSNSTGTRIGAVRARHQRERELQGAGVQKHFSRALFDCHFLHFFATKVH
jgi:hypothetical protein